MHDLGEVLYGAVKIKFEIRFDLIEEFAPGTRIKWRPLRQSGLYRLAQEMAFKDAYVLDPGPVFSNKRIALIPFLQNLIAQLNQFQFEEREVFSSQSTQVSVKIRMFGFDCGVRQVRALAQKQIRHNFAAQHLDFRIV